MLSLIGFITICYLGIRYFPDIVKFSIKVIIVLIGLYFLIGAVIWLMGTLQLMGITWAWQINQVLLGLN
jgi:hypothetical protein